MAGVGIFPFYKTVKDVHATKNVQLVVSVAITIFVSKTLVPYWYWMMLVMA